MKMVKYGARYVIAIALLTAMACSSDDTKKVESTDKSLVLVVHASPDAPGVGLYLDDQLVNTSALEFPTNTGYLEVTPGLRNVKVKPFGSDTAVITADLSLEAGKNYSVFAINTVAKIEPLVVVDDLSAPAPGKAHVRFLHLSPDAPAVDVRVKNGPVLWSNRTFKDDGSVFTPVDAGTYDLEVVVAGTDTVVLPLNGVVLDSGSIYTVFAKGLVSQLGAELIRNR